MTCSYNISVPYTECDCYERLVGSPVTCSRYLWRSKYKQHCWVEYDSTGGVRQLTKCPTCSYCAHDLSRENSLTIRIILIIIIIVFSVWIFSTLFRKKSQPGPLGPSSKHRLQPTLEETSSAVFFLFSHAQIMRARKLGNIPHCQTSGDSICPCWSPPRLQNSSLGQLEDMIKSYLWSYKPQVA